MLRPFYLFFFKLFGWRINGALPLRQRYICAVAPHTSNWDFMVGLAARSILRIQKAKFLGKSQLFKAPFGWFFRAMGGIPVDRSSSHDMVEQVSKIALSTNEFILAIAPEGTRKKVDKLKSGFWYIAKKGNLRIVPVGFDFAKKEVVIGEAMIPNEIDADMETLLAFYRGISGRNPELGIR